MRVNVSKLRHFKGHQGAVYALLKGNGQTFFSAGGDGTVMRWHLDEDRGENCGSVPGTILSLHYLPESDHMLVGTMEGELFVLDLTHRKIVSNQKLGELALFDIQLLPGSELFAVLTGSGTLSMFDFSFGPVGKVDLTKSS